MALGCDGHATDAEGQPQARYEAVVRWTSFGVPHLVADDLPSIAYAAGYVTSKDAVCILADQFVRLRSERSRFFGPGEMDANFERTPPASDLGPHFLHAS